MLKRLLGLMIASLPIVVYAATPTLPASVDAARAGKQLAKPPLAPTSAPSTTEKTTVPSEAVAPGAENITFVLNHLEVSGNTIFSYQQLSPLFQQYLGKEISLADLHKITKAITLKYRDAGYILTRAILPAQVIDKGLVKIVVIEGYAQAATIEGKADGAQGLLQKYGQATTTARPLNIATLERYSLLSNDIPGMNQVKTILQPPEDPNAPVGATNLQMVPDFSKASGFISFDNRGTKFLGPNEWSTGGAVNSVLQSGDQWGVQGLTTSDWDELKYINVYTNQPIGITGAIFNLSGSYSRTQPGFILTPLEVLGESKEGVADVEVPWIRSRKQSLYTTLAFDYLDNSTDLQVFPATLFDDHIRSVRLAANYYLKDSWKGANQIGLQVSQGLPILDASKVDQTTQSRFLGDPKYTKENATISRLQGITENTSLLVSAIGQYTDDPLLSAEQFAFGGTQYGQAYDPAEFTGDRGIAAKAELRYNQAPEWKYLNSLQYFAFYDIGKAWNILPETLTGIPQSQTATSTGGGVRIGFNQYVFGAVEVAQPLTKIVNTYQNYAPRIFFSITVTGKTHTEAEQPLLPDDAAGPTPDQPEMSSTATNGPVEEASSALGAVSQPVQQ